MNKNANVKPVPGSAYTTAVAWESFEPEDGRFVESENHFDGVSFEDIERLARIVAYKVAHKISLGYKMDPYADPLTYL